MKLSKRGQYIVLSLYLIELLALFTAMLLLVNLISSVESMKQPTSHPAISCAVRLDTAQETTYCINIEQGRQVFHPPLDGVTRACAGAAPALVAYESFDAPNRSPNAQTPGDIEIYLQAGQCQSVEQAVHLPAMSVTEVRTNPIQEGTTGTPQRDLHEVEPVQCANNFLLVIFTDHGQRCFAGKGSLHLTTPLTGVVKICSVGKGIVGWENKHSLTGITVDLDPEHCILTSLLLKQAAIDLNTIDLQP